MTVSAFETLSSPVFVAFVLTGAWLVYCLVDVRVTRQSPRLIRVGSYLGLIANVTARSAKALIIPTLSVMLAASLAPLWAPHGNAHTANSGATSVMRFVGIAPGVALVLQVALMLLFFVLIRLIVEFSLLVLSFAAAVALSTVVWVWAAASASGFIELGPLADFRSYVFAAALGEHPGVSTQVALTYAVVILALVSSALVLDFSARDRMPQIPVWLPSCVAAFVLILVATLAQGVSRVDFFTAAVTIFWGSHGTVIQMLIEVALLVGYAFTFQFRINEQLGQWGAQTLIRYGSRAKQLLAIARAELLRVFIYCGALLVSTLVAYVLLGGRDFLIPAGESRLLLYQLTVAQVLQLSFYVACVTAAVLVFNNALAGLVTVGILAGLAAIPFSSNAHVPIQASSAALVYDGGWPAALINSLVLFVGIAIALAITVLSSRIGEVGRRLSTKLGAQLP